MKTVIAPTDFSAISENACFYAVKLAADVKAELIIFHAMQLPVAVGDYSVSVNLFDEKGVEKELEAIKGRLSAATGNAVNISIKNIVGSPEYEIQELCKATKPFAVVMGTHRDSALQRFFLGSTTAYSAQHLRCPVIVVPESVSYQPIRKVALATDLKDIYEAPVPEIEMIVKIFNAKLEVFYAGKNEKAINKTAIDNMLLDHRLAYLDPKFYSVEDEDVLVGINTLAKQQGTDLLIVISKKHGPFHQSKSRDFIFYSPIPVVIIHEDDVRPPDK